MPTEYKYLPDVVTLELNKEKCSGCGSCIDVCPHQILFLDDSKKIEVTDRDGCMECGACSNNCPTEAITVDAGVGCAAALIAGALGKSDSLCCCTSEPIKFDENKIS